MAEGMQERITDQLVKYQEWSRLYMHRVPVWWSRMCSAVEILLDGEEIIFVDADEPAEGQVPVTKIFTADAVVKVSGSHHGNDNYVELDVTIQPLNLAQLRVWSEGTGRQGELYATLHATTSGGDTFRVPSQGMGLPEVAQLARSWSASLRT